MPLERNGIHENVWQTIGNAEPKLPIDTPTVQRIEETFKLCRFLVSYLTHRYYGKGSPSDLKKEASHRIIYWNIVVRPTDDSLDILRDFILRVEPIVDYPDKVRKSIYAQRSSIISQIEFLLDEKAVTFIRRIREELYREHMHRNLERFKKPVD